MEILLIKENTNDCIDLINQINCISNNIRVFKITSNLTDCIYILENHTINVIIIDYNIFKKINSKSLLLIQSKINFMIIISNEIIPTIKEKSIFSTKEKLTDTLTYLYNSYLDNETHIRKVILEELKYLGYNTSYNGTKYLLECIYYIYSHFDKYNDDSFKEVYSIVAQKYNKSVNTFKCNITRATSIMFYECEESKLKSYLGTCTLPKMGTRIIIQTILNKLNNL